MLAYKGALRGSHRLVPVETIHARPVVRFVSIHLRDVRAGPTATLRARVDHGGQEPVQHAGYPSLKRRTRTPACLYYALLQTVKVAFRHARFCTLRPFRRYVLMTAPLQKIKN